MTSRQRFVVLTPFSDTHAVASVAALRGIEADVAHTESGAAVVLETRAPEYDDWDISELLGHAPSQSGSEDSADSDELSPSNDGQRAAQIFSQISRYGVVLFQADLGEDVGVEVGTSGVITARRYVQGRPGEEVPAGLLLNTLDTRVEDLLLGLLPVEEIDPEVVRPAQAQEYIHRHDSDQAGDS